MKSRSLMAAFVLALAATMAGPRPAAQSSAIDPSLYAGLKWRMAGPFRAGRVNAVTGVAGQANTFYFGSVGGGVWKTENSGRTWTPIFDGNPVASIGAIAVAPSNPDILYVGTGEADMRDSIQFGDGMYKSSDAGRTWTHIGLEATRQIGRVIVHPRDPNTVFVAALGHVYGPHPDRGVYRSKDGGATWQKVLFKGDSVGAIDVAFDPSNPQTVYAAMWAVRRPPWFIYAPANGPGSGLFKSTDGGSTWKPLTSGLPTDGLGRMGIAVSPANPRRVYVIADAKEGGLFRSDDAGATFTKVSGDNRIWQRGWYFEKVAVDPKNPDVVYVPNTGVYKSTDGGKTWGAPIKASPGGDDYHQIWISPNDSNQMIVGGDQGTIVSVDGAKTWSSWYNQPTAQLYHVAPDFRFPYWLTGAQQDSGAVGTPERTYLSVLSMHSWVGLCAGGESGYTAPDPLHPEILFGGTVEKCNVETGATKNVTPETPQQGVTYRHAWTQPLVFSQADRRALYFANQFVYKTTDGGETWTKISDDLTREDPGVPPNLDASAAADAPEGKRRGVVYTLAPSPIRATLLWAGTDDGLIKVTRDDGGSWTDVTPPDITPWTKVTMIDASHFDAATAFAAAERHQLEDYEPHLYRTRDMGKTWQAITKGLPAGVYVQTVKEDPVRRGLLFCGTERGVYVSFDEGDTWQSLQLNLPATSMRDLAIKDDDLIVATHGRGFWVLDDMTALRQLDASSAGAAAILFRPAPAIALPPPSEQGTPLPKDEPSAENPPAGAIIDYYLKAVPGSPVVLENPRRIRGGDSPVRERRRASAARPERAVGAAGLGAAVGAAPGDGRHAPVGLGPAGRARRRRQGRPRRRRTRTRRSAVVGRAHRPPLSRRQDLYPAARGARRSARHSVSDDIVVPLRSHRQQRARLVQKVQHAVPGFVLLTAGAQTLSGRPDGAELAVAVVEVAAGALLIGNMVRMLHKSRHLLHRKRPDDVHPHDARHGVDWFDIFAAVVVLVEGLERWMHGHHFPRPAILTAVVLFALGIWHNRIHRAAEGRRALKVSREGLSIGGRPFKQRRLRASWAELRSIEVGERWAAITSRSGQVRKIDLSDVEGAAHIRAALETARARMQAAGGVS